VFANKQRLTDLFTLVIGLQKSDFKSVTLF